MLLPLLVAKSGKNEVATEKTLTEQRLRDNVASVASVATNFEASPQISGMNETTQQKALSKEPSKPLASDERPLIESAPKSNSTQSINSDDDLIGCETKAEWIASHRSGKGAKPCQPTVRQLDPHKVEIKERGTAAAPESNPLRINYGDDWGANLAPDEAANLAKARAEIKAEVSRSPAAIKTVATPADEMPEAARKMEMEAYRRLPETRAAAGLPPVETGTPPLKEQGDYCASRGIEYLEAFWKELNEPEKRQIGGKYTLAAWRRTAREVDAAQKAPAPSRCAPLPPPVSPDDPEAVLREERAGMAAAGVPEVYLAAWGDLQARKPREATEAQWKQAIEDAGRFLDDTILVKAAEDNGWTARDLFDASDRGVPQGLIWFLRGRPIAAIDAWFAPAQACIR